MSRLKIGIVGTGYISKYHYDAFSRNEDVTVAGMCTHSNRQKLERMCKEWGIKPYSSFDEMAEDPEIDALVIASINADHYPQIMKSMNKGKHILVEKPLVTDFNHLDEIEKASAEKGMLVFPGHNFLYREAVRKAKEILQEGKLGTVSYSTFSSFFAVRQDHAVGWRREQSLAAGGAMMDSGHHQVYMSLYLLGLPKMLHSFGSRVIQKNMDCEDISQIQLLYPDESIGTILQAWTSNFNEGMNEIRIVGDKGQLSITDALYFNGEKLSSEVGYAASFNNQARAFTDCILKGTRPLHTLKDVRQALKLTYAAYRSSEKKEVVEF